MTYDITKHNSQNLQNRIKGTENLNNLLGTWLLVCTSLSLTIIFAGFILLGIHGFAGIKPFVRLDQILAATIIHWGVLALILTPVIQLVIAVVKFSLDRDKVFTGISLSILIFLGICFALALL